MSYERDRTNILFWMPLSKHWSNKKNHSDRTTISPSVPTHLVPNNSITISAPLPTQIWETFCKIVTYYGVKIIVWWLLFENNN